MGNIKKSKKNQDISSEKNKKPIVFEVIGLILMFLGALVLVLHFVEVKQLNFLLVAFSFMFGTVGSYLLPLWFIFIGALYIVHLRHLHFVSFATGVSLFFLTLLATCQLYSDPSFHVKNLASELGGFSGMIIVSPLYALFAKLTFLPLIFLFLLSLSLTFQTPLWKIIVFPFRLIYMFVISPIRDTMREKKESEVIEGAEKLMDEERDSGLEEIIKKQRREEKGLLKTDNMFVVNAKSEEDDDEVVIPVTGVPSKKDPMQLEFDGDKLNGVNENYKLPSSSLLTLNPKPKILSENTEENIRALDATLKSFLIDAKIVGVVRGPRVTRYEIEPAPGVKISKITALTDDITLALRALNVRIEAPVPGKGVIGIEVPNKESVIVDMREILESETFIKAKSPITIGLGKDITGNSVCTDLASMPHVLIAGATNSGKSVCINTIICSILMRATPQQVKFLMVDPKRVELSLFQNIPHLIAPVAYDAKHAAGLLRWAIKEMEQRYVMLSERGVRNIASFNELAVQEQMEELPYIVIVIDELADLMMQAAAEFEASICRIAQLARAVGIHLVIATQRPSVNVITGTIKANVPSRIAFAVASQIDSRTILDCMGAERLVGKGDMLFAPVGAQEPVRVQGAFLSENDVRKVVEFVKEQGKPVFTEEIIKIEDDAAFASNGGEANGLTQAAGDELFNLALEYIRANGQASTSLLQRKFSIGYNRAARIMDEFEARGYVGPSQGNSKPREVIFAPDTSQYSSDDDGSFT